MKTHQENFCRNGEKTERFHTFKNLGWNANDKSNVKEVCQGISANVYRSEIVLLTVNERRKIGSVSLNFVSCVCGVRIMENMMCIYHKGMVKWLIEKRYPSVLGIGHVKGDRGQVSQYGEQKSEKKVLNKSAVLEWKLL